MSNRSLAALDSGHRLALAVSIGNWHGVTASLRVILGRVLTDDPEAAELNELLGDLDKRLISLRADYAPVPAD